MSFVSQPALKALILSDKDVYSCLLWAFSASLDDINALNVQDDVKNFLHDVKDQYYLLEEAFRITWAEFNSNWRTPISGMWGGIQLGPGRSPLMDIRIYSGNKTVFHTMSHPTVILRLASHIVHCTLDHLPALIEDISPKDQERIVKVVNEIRELAEKLLGKLEISGESLQE